MKKKQDTFHKKLLVVALLAVYFFATTTHLFFIPCLTQASQQTPPLTGNSIFKRKQEYLTMAYNHLSYTQRADKSLEERRTVSDFIKTILSFFTVLLFVPLVWRSKPKFLADISDRQILYRHSYLSLRVIRI